MEKRDLGKTSLGMEANVAAVLSYVLGPVTGIIFYLVEKDNKFVRFHAMQSMIIFGGLLVINLANSFVLKIILPWQVSSMISGILGIIGLVLWVVLMIKAYQGDYFKLPVIGDMAEKNL
jgi:uncharacterized membrane protein